jgi:ABC-2 type transport system permease protein
MIAGFGSALGAEMLKLRRSRVAPVTILAIALAPLMGGLLVFALRNPGQAGLIGAKATAFGTADWPGYLRFLVIGEAAGGLLVFGIVAAWVFGREFSDRTAADLLALPTSRLAIVAAKLVTVAAWSVVLTAVVLGIGLVVGSLLGLPAWSGDALLECIRQLVVAGLLSVMLVTPIALVASVWRGYLPAVGLMLLVLILANTLGQIGAGQWFPWAVPALAAGVAGTSGGSVGPASYVLVLATSAAGAVLTAAWWVRADQS